MKAKKQSGFTLVEIMIVVAIIGILAVLSFPSYVRARQTTQLNICLERLRQIDGAIQQWAMENNKSLGDTASDAELNVYLKKPIAGIQEPASGGRYTQGPIGTDTLCPAYNVATHPATI